MSGTTGVLIALIVLTVALAAVFLVRSSITEGVTGKILAFVGLCVLPVLCIVMGMSFHLQRSKQTAYCISCHSMESHGRSLYLLDAKYIPAQHFQNDLVPSNEACYTCHTNYTMYGPLMDKLKGLRYLYMEYVSTPPKVIHLLGKYQNSDCLHCHAGTRDFEDHLAQMPPIAKMTTNQISCVSSGCHNSIHDVSQVDHLAMWTGGRGATAVASAPAPVAASAKAAGGATRKSSAAATAAPASASSSPAPSKAKSGAAAAPSSASAGGAAGGAGAAGGRGLFASQRCSQCHGTSGEGGSGPALTHVAAQYPPAKLAALLEAPTAPMKTGGMVPLTLKAAQMKSLVAYVSGLGGKSAASATTASASASSSPAAANKTAAATAGPMSTLESGGQVIFEAHGCAGCHGVGGIGGTAAASALAGVGAKLQPARVAIMLRHPTARMQDGGMPPVSLSDNDLKAIAAYVAHIAGASGRRHQPGK